IYIKIYFLNTVKFVFPQTISPLCSCSIINTNFGTNSNIPQQLCIPSLAYDQTSIWLTWNKPDIYKNIIDFNIYMNNNLIGNAKNNLIKNTIVGPYFQNFYKNDINNFHTKIFYETFFVNNLQPNTIYKFFVRSVDVNGNESGNSNEIIAKTASNYEKIIDITSTGAKGDGSTLNTLSIQNAINKCSNSTSPFNCKVIIPKGIFISGPIFLRSQMTFELANGAILRATSNSAKFPNQWGNTPISFLNAANGSLTNIRIIGLGSIDGNGWKLSSTVTDELGKQIPVYPKGSASTIKNLGVLAANQVAANGNNYNSRSRLAAFNYVTNLFIGGGLTLINPSMTTIGIADSSNISIINVRFQTYNTNNGDGIDIGRSTNIQIIGNFFDTGDDCIAMGTGCGGNAGKDNPLKCVLIRNNYFRHGHGAPAFGGSIGDWVMDVLVEDSVSFLTDNGLRFKSAPECGAFSGDTTNGHPIVFLLNYPSNPSGGNAKIPTQFSQVNIEQISIDSIKPTKSGSALYIMGSDGNNIHQFIIKIWFVYFKLN
ncbi:Polygalacturonase, partial [Meloidogyne graminicola]